ncbi:zinc metallopeptidase [Clostridium hydrogeniformans]|uniref:zinc metallopeptidase n=1 Tax=Clostridium hydrogeniformans TaxID=349933 RepID=UPI0004818487|nr:zinc metallopeptidase [Clostridium hydrogeniformans]
MPFFYDSTYLFLIPAMLISLWAQFKVSSTFENYSKVRGSRGITGAEAARNLLDSNGLYYVPIEIVRGKLSDHYDPTVKVLRLSEDVYYGTSVASVGVAAHEVGHAIQHKNSYKPLVIRNSIVPAVNLGSSLSWILFFAGIVLSIKPLVTLGIVFFSAVVVFQIITLPVEFDASARALKEIRAQGILYGEEERGAKKVLDAAALTYVAATIMAVSQLIRLVAISNSRDN